MAKSKISGGSVGGPFPTSSKSEDDYRAEDDHRTLTRADEIHRDQRRFTAAARHARKTVRTVARVYRATGGGRSTSR